ncbi:hypothetical protein [Actinotalea sp.]|uniref:hypothetical protein n=1 Tax=Actinotalea sp. TaxID=1872145 RepID=UPI00356A00D2
MPGLQLTGLAHRVMRLVGAGQAPSAAGPSIGTTGAWADEVADRVLARLAATERRRWDEVADARPEARVLLRRRLAATGSVAAVAELAESWDSWAPEVRAVVLDPIGRSGTAARQTDQTTCGSACLVLLAAAGDPGLAGWLAAGTVPRLGVPPELGAADPAVLARLASLPAAARYGAVQRVVQHRTNARSVLGLPWPAALGTPPWGAAREARFLGLAFRHRLLDDTDTADLAPVLDTVARVVEAGVPLPLYAGGDTSRGWSTAVPRHVVLAVGHGPAGFRVWEPSVGAVVEVSRAELLRGGAPLPALGGWSHLVWAVLPR